jgi:Tfp pilus assembly protein PilW
MYVTMAKMDFMIISSTRSKRQVGFTLTELIIATTIGSFVLVGVLTSFLMLGRSGANIANYSMMESQSRRGLEEFGQDVRMASDVTWNSATSITLTVPDNYTSTSNRVTYGYDSGSKTFYRKPGDHSSTNSKYVLIKNVSTDFAYSRYDRRDNLLSSAVPASAASALALNYSTKRILIATSVKITSTTVASASNNIVSASYILRNKPSN